MAGHSPRPAAATSPAAEAEAHPIARPSTALPQTAQRRWRSTELLGGASEVEIEHGEGIYRLRLTAMGKLILTK